jgi:hypothetical protein
VRPLELDGDLNLNLDLNLDGWRGGEASSRRHLGLPASRSVAASAARSRLGKGERRGGGGRICVVAEQAGAGKEAARGWMRRWSSSHRRWRGDREGERRSGGRRGGRLVSGDTARRESPQKCSRPDAITHFAAGVADTAGGDTVALLSSFCRWGTACRNGWRWSG